MIGISVQMSKDKRTIFWYWIENSPEREMNQSQSWMYEPMVESDHEVRNT
jgi:hypothetical protein